MLPPNPTAELRTLGDLLSRIGGVAPDRIRIRPPPGSATEDDWVAADRRGEPACELVDGVLVEKPVGLKESILAAYLIAVLNPFVRDRELGFVSGESGAMALFPGLVRIPDVAFISTGRAKQARVATSPIPRLAPELAIEVLSPSNTPAEMRRKREDYFGAGAKIVWQIDPENRTAAVYTSVDQPTVLNESETLDGADVLPGFVLGLKDLFGELDRLAAG